MIPRIPYLLTGLILLGSQAQAGLGVGSSADPVPVEVPEVHYAVIDLGKLSATAGGTGVMPDTADVDQVAIGDDGRTAFLWHEGDWQEDKTYMVAKFQNGQFAAGSPKAVDGNVSVSQAHGAHTNYETTLANFFSYDYNNNSYYYVPTLALNADGNIAIWAFWYYGALGADGGSFSSLDNSGYGIWKYDHPESTAFYCINDDWTYYYHCFALFLTNTGLLIGSNDWNWSSPYGDYLIDEFSASGGLSESVYFEHEDNYRQSLGCQSVSESGHIGMAYCKYSLPSYSTVKSQSLIGLPDGSTIKIKDTTATDLASIAVLNDNDEFVFSITEDQKKNYYYYKGEESQGKLEELFPWQVWDSLVRYGDSPKMISLTNSGKLLLNLENRENKGTEEKPKYEWVPRTFIADTYHPFLAPSRTKKDLKIAKFPEGWDIPFDQSPTRCQITEKNLIATTVTQTKKQNDDGTWTDIPEDQRKKRPGLLIPINVYVVDRDDPKKKWGDEKLLSGDKPIYSGESCGDMVSFKLGGTDSWTSVSWTWTATGPNGETINGPTGTGKTEWKIADGDQDTAVDWVKWKPGKWKIKVQIGTMTVQFEQEVGIRTEEYFVVGAIKSTSNSTAGVASSTITSYSCPWLLSNILFSKFNNAPSEGGVPENSADRFWVTLQLLNETKNQNHGSSLRPEETADNAFGLSASDHYRGFGRCQFKYLPEEGKLNKAPTPVDKLVQKIGDTPAPCMFDPTVQSLSAAASPGEAHEKSGDFYGDDGNYDKNFTDDTRFHYLLKFRAGTKGQSGYKELNRRELPWVFFKIWFNMEDGLVKTNFNAVLQPNQPEDSGDFTGVPSFYLYRRYYDLQSKAYKIDTIHSLEMGDPDRVKNWMQTISGKVTGTPNYP